MKILDVEQGSIPWMVGRIGRPTSSRFDSVMTATKLQPAKTNYLAELVAEFILQQPIEWGSTNYTKRGTSEEVDARRYYSLREDVDVEQVGLILRDDGLVACSPDGLVGTEGGLEIKVFGAIKHMQCVLGQEKHPIGQCQGMLYLTGREWWDILYYNVHLPKHVERIYRDDKWQTAWAPILKDFLERLEAAKERFKDQCVPRPWHPEQVDALKASDRARTDDNVWGAPFGYLAHRRRLEGHLTEGRNGSRNQARP